MIRVAAVGDVHCGLDSRGYLRPHLQHLGECADLFLLAGDLTRLGDPAEAAVLADELRDVPVPMVAVLGNHDYHSDLRRSVAAELKAVGVIVLDPGRTVVPVGDVTVGIAGSKGFGGGFAGACGSDFGEPEMKAFVRHTKAVADRLRHDLEALETDVRIALLHYSPVEDTLAGERLEIFPFLGSYLLAEAVDSAGADLVLHGHAHKGTEKGVTPCGINVRNVAQPVLRRAYGVYCLRPDAVRQPRLAALSDAV